MSRAWYHICVDSCFFLFFFTWCVCPAWVHAGEVDLFVLRGPPLCQNHLLSLQNDNKTKTIPQHMDTCHNCFCPAASNTAVLNLSPLLCSERRPWCHQMSPSRTGGHPHSASVWACHLTTPWSVRRQLHMSTIYISLFQRHLHCSSLTLTHHSGVFSLPQCRYQCCSENVCTWK